MRASTVIGAFSVVRGSGPTNQLVSCTITESCLRRATRHFSPHKFAHRLMYILSTKFAICASVSVLLSQQVHLLSQVLLGLEVLQISRSTMRFCENVKSAMKSYMGFSHVEFCTPTDVYLFLIIWSIRDQFVRVCGNECIYRSRCFSCCWCCGRLMQCVCWHVLFTRK